MFDFKLDSSTLILALIVIFAVYIILELRSFSKLTNKEKKERVIEWLIYACTVAEQTYGSKTGKIKLRYVYDAFIQAFPVISKLISYEKFRALVDEALIEVNKLIETNKDIYNIVHNIVVED